MYNHYSTPHLLQYDTIGKSSSLRQIHLDELDLYNPNLYSKTKSQVAIPRYNILLVDFTIAYRSLQHHDIFYIDHPTSRADRERVLNHRFSGLVSTKYKLFILVM